jgi:hypothetical protein
MYHPVHPMTKTKGELNPSDPLHSDLQLQNLPSSVLSSMEGISSEDHDPGVWQAATGIWNKYWH